MPEALLDQTCVQLDKLECKFTGVGWKGVGDCEIE